MWGAFAAGADRLGERPAGRRHEPQPLGFVRGSRRGAGRRSPCSSVWCPAIADGLVGAAAEALEPRPSPVHLALWHGVNLALVLSAVTLAGGAVLFVVRRPVGARAGGGAALPERRRRLPRSACGGSNVVADRVTGVVQNGSLPVLRGRDPPDRSVAPGVAAAHVVGLGRLARGRSTRPAHLAGRRPHRGRRARRGTGAPAVRRRACSSAWSGYGMAGLFVVAGRAGPGAHPGRGRDAVDGAVRARAAPPPDRVRGRCAAIGRARPHRRRGRRRGGGVRLRADRRRGNRTRPVRLGGDGRPGAARRRRPQRRQRDPRRLPRASTPSARSPCSRSRRSAPSPWPGAGGRRRRVAVPPSAPGQRGDDRVKRLVVLDVSVRVIFHAVLVGSVYLLFAGHNQPGGGFVGGLVAGAAVRAALRRRRHRRGARAVRLSAVDDPRRRPARWPRSPRSCPLLARRRPCSSQRYVTRRPAAARARSTSPAPPAFDIGVYLVVVGARAHGLRGLRRRPDEAADVSVRASRAHGSPPLLFGIGTYLVLQRTLSRIIIGLGLLSHGANSAAHGRRSPGRPPLVGSGDRRDVQRPAPPGAGAHRHRHHASASPPSCSRSPTAAGCSPHDDEVEDDLEDRRIGREASPTRRSTTTERRATDRRGRRRERPPPPPDRAAAARRRRCRSLVGRSPHRAAGHRRRRARRRCSCVVDRAPRARRPRRPVAVAGRRVAGADGHHARRRPALGPACCVRRLGDAAGRARLRHRPAGRRAQPRRLPVRVPRAGRRRVARRSSPATCSTCSSPSR